jgi:hypothetical protein
MPGKRPQVLGLDLNRSERAGTRSGCARGRSHAYRKKKIAYRQKFLNLSGASSV